VSTTGTTIMSDPASYGLCPVAGAFGKDNPDLDNLRAFRDNTLAQSAIGCKVIDVYYANAGSINAALNRSAVLRPRPVGF